MAEGTDTTSTAATAGTATGETARNRSPRGLGGVGRWSIAVAVVAALILLASVTPSPYAIERPGPVVDAFGEMASETGEATPVVRIRGAETYPTSGAMNVLSVSINGTPDRPADWLSVVGTLFDPTRTAVSLSSLYPEGLTAEERAEQNAAMMKASQAAATAAALRRLGEPVDERLSVAGVATDGPADGKLRAGDVIRTADGVEVGGLSELREIVGSAQQGRAVRLGIERDGAEQEQSVVPETADDGSRLLGITVGEEFSFPFDVSLDLDDIGGPSAGLVFALAVYDKLTPGALTGGERISGTGTIDADGMVGPIGGLPQKIWGAAGAGSTLMLMPRDNCADLPDRLPEGMRIVPVSTFGEAIAAVEEAAAAGPDGAERAQAPCQ